MSITECHKRGVFGAGCDDAVSTFHPTRFIHIDCKLFDLRRVNPNIIKLISLEAVISKVPTGPFPENLTSLQM